MNHILPRCRLAAALLTAVLTACMAPSAQAVNFVQLDGEFMTFFYDADFWRGNGASVSGNTITIDVSEQFDLRAEVPRGERLMQQSDISWTSVFAVAKPGYLLPITVTAQANIDYTLAAAGTYIRARMSGNTLGGYYGSNGFTIVGSGGDYNAGTTLTSSGTAATGIAWISETSPALNYAYSTVGVSTDLNLEVNQLNAGSVRGAFNSVSYQFGVLAAPVPEPSTYAMLLAGAALIGFAARRRAKPH